MENFIIELLRASGADGWTVTDERRRGWEFYFIRHALDQNRARDVEHITLTVYRRFSEDGKDFLGSASARLAPTASREEGERLIAQLLGEAGLIRNPLYSLHEPHGTASAAAVPAACPSWKSVDCTRIVPSAMCVALMERPQRKRFEMFFE